MEPRNDETDCVCILNGIHRGAVVRVGETPLSLGGSSDCDASLADASAVNCVVDLTRDGDGEIVVTLQSGDVRIGSRSVTAKRPLSLSKGAVLRVGDVCIARGANMNTAQNDVRVREKRSSARNWIIAVAASLVLVGGLGAVGGGSADAFISFDGASNQPVKAVDFADGKTMAAASLQREIDRVGLTRAVTVENLPLSEQILVTGAVTPDERATWTSVARWFDGRFGDKVMLETDLNDRNSTLVVPFRIKSVIMAPNPRVVIQDGRAFPIGSLLPGGWEIRAIADMKVVLAQGNRELKISF